MTLATVWLLAIPEEDLEGGDVENPGAGQREEREGN